VDVGSFEPREDSAAARARWGVEGRRVVAYVGTFQPYEGLELLVSAMSAISRAEPGACLVIAGGSADPNGPMEARLRSLVEQHGVGAHVRFTGRLPHAQVADVYAMADVVVYPRINTRTTELTTPLKPLEAMAMGRAVVMSDLPALRELVTPERTGIMFRAGDAGELSAACVRLLRDPHLRRRLGEEARAWTHRERNWPALVTRYAQVYGAAAAKAAAAAGEARVAPGAAAL
jgi:glycosyltransferase involved in cell wall biosynthesis